MPKGINKSGLIKFPKGGNGNQIITIIIDAGGRVRVAGGASVKQLLLCLNKENPN